MAFWLDQFPIFLLVFVRLTAFFVAAPIFSFRGVPNTFKVGLAFFIAIVSYSTISIDQSIPLDMSFIVYIMKEVTVGLAIGFIAALLLYTVQIAGGFIDFNMGFAIANVVDPQTGAQVPIIGNFKYMLALLFLLTVNAHHLMIQGVIRSYQIIPLENMFVPIGSESMVSFISSLFVHMFFVSLQLAIPVVGALFLVDVALGILSRTVPQVNIFVVGLPLKIFLGFVMILITLPTFFYLLNEVLRNLINTMGELIYILGGS